MTTRRTFLVGLGAFTGALWLPKPAPTIIDMGANLVVPEPFTLSGGPLNGPDVDLLRPDFGEMARLFHEQLTIQAAQIEWTQHVNRYFTQIVSAPVSYEFVELSDVAVEVRGNDYRPTRVWRPLVSSELSHFARRTPVVPLAPHMR